MASAPYDLVGIARHHKLDPLQAAGHFQPARSSDQQDFSTIKHFTSTSMLLSTCDRPASGLQVASPASQQISCQAAATQPADQLPSASRPRRSVSSGYSPEVGDTELRGLLAGVGGCCVARVWQCKRISVLPFSVSLV
jgi:hypothetical protein